jgi:hypothetical protein
MEPVSTLPSCRCRWTARTPPSEEGMLLLVSGRASRMQYMPLFGQLKERSIHTHVPTYIHIFIGKSVRARTRSFGASDITFMITLHTWPDGHSTAHRPSPSPRELPSIPSRAHVGTIGPGHRPSLSAAGKHDSLHIGESDCGLARASAGLQSRLSPLSSAIALRYMMRGSG